MKNTIKLTQEQKQRAKHITRTSNVRLGQAVRVEMRRAQRKSAKLEQHGSVASATGYILTH